MDEFALIAAARDIFGTRSDRIVRGSGDDAAVVRARAVSVTSVDAMVDGVHFRLGATASAEDVGHRALAAALSDLAAMGADPGEAYVVLGLPGGPGRGGDARHRLAGWRPSRPGAARRSSAGTSPPRRR